MKFLTLAFFFFNFLESKSYIIGLQKEIKEHKKYVVFKKSPFFQKANIVVVILEENQFIKHPIRPSRNIFGYTKYSILIYQNEKLIYEKFFRLSSFDSKDKNVIMFNEKQHIENRKKVVNFAFNLLCLTDYKEKNKIKAQLNAQKIDEPTSNLILFNENGKIKAIGTNLKDFAYSIKNTKPLTIIPKILNKYDVKIIKFERIYNHGIYSYLTINNTIIKIPNKNYFQNLYKTLLKVELIYLMDKEIFDKDTSIFFMEFDKLNQKTTEELIKLINIKKKG